MFFISCFGQEQPVKIPIPDGLNDADPLIESLLTKTADGIAADPKNVDKWVLHASALLANAYYEESVEASSIAIAMDPSGRLPLRYRQAVALWRLNKQAQAIAELQQILKQEPKYDFGWRNLSSWYLEQGELGKAQDAILQAWEQAPERLGTLATYVRVLMQQENSEKAIELLTPRLESEKTPPHLYFLAAQAYRRVGDVDKMERAAQKGEPLPKRWPDPWLNEIALLATGKRMLASNGLALLRTKGPKAALPVLAQALAADPANSQIRAAYASALFNQKREGDAVAILEGISNQEEAVPEFWLTYANFALEKAKRGEKQIWLPKAMEYFKRAESAGGISPKLYSSMARLATAMGKSSSSAEYYVKGATLLIEENDLQSAKIFIGEGLTNNKDDARLIELYEAINSE